ncbi:unnamed protein product [Blepharisma stoltei]|uniref:Uncharacterized protein n=1 Tax=Blepharisma stoltei TaxID=1481888 RepID=A0AAU9K9A5_9CILI|nr:unnamed protein product [Blepharisma stoltei]
MDPKSSPPNEFSIFSNMFSLINPKAPVSDVSLCLELPSIQDFAISGIIEKTDVSKPCEKKVLKEKRRHKKSQRITACKHINKKHYAKGMCNSCYHRYGRDTYAWICEHTERKLYAKGMCELCYNKCHAESSTKIKSQLK